MSPKQLVIPLEIVFKILEFIKDDDFQSLKNTSVVCKTWQHESQKHLFHTFKLTISDLDVDGANHPLQELGSEPLLRIRDYVDGLVLTLKGNSPGNMTTIMPADTNPQVQMLRMLLPLRRLSHFTLDGNSHSFNWEESTAVMDCIESICSGPMLEKLRIAGEIPFPKLLSLCPPSLKTLDASFLSSATLENSLRKGRQEPIELEHLAMQYAKVPQITTSSTLPDPTDLISYILYPQALISLRSLKSLKVTAVRPFTRSVSKVFSTCRHSLEYVSIWAYGRSLQRILLTMTVC